ncbi:hypothetical protein EG68_08173 [Paragonimus skrjabini miyazakii]|uniref:Uncharacterized protein n=1 Tax=Paragonimus skrjabini miyazakii TaxID=59628 RepID=A0A8S9YKT0_9TREM|nr:hypothetical protein EG68_08173 [Paragonimus skrjabini miyazakii]
MVEKDVSELGISKNLLKMNFMRRTLLAQEKSNPSTRSDILPNAQEYTFQLPPAVKAHITKRSSVLSGMPKIVLDKCLFEIYGVPAGFRQSYGGFNITETSKQSGLSKSEESTNPTHAFFDDSADGRVSAYIRSQSSKKTKTDTQHTRGIRRTLCHLSGEPPPKKTKRRKTQ